MESVPPHCFQPVIALSGDSNLGWPISGAQGATAPCYKSYVSSKIIKFEGDGYVYTNGNEVMAVNRAGLIMVRYKLKSSIWSCEKTTFQGLQLLFVGCSDGCLHIFVDPLKNLVSTHKDSFSNFDTNNEDMLTDYNNSDAASTHYIYNFSLLLKHAVLQRERLCTKLSSKHPKSYNKRLLEEQEKENMEQQEKEFSNENNLSEDIEPFYPRNERINTQCLSYEDSENISYSLKLKGVIVISCNKIFENIIAVGNTDGNILILDISTLRSVRVLCICRGCAITHESMKIGNLNEMPKCASIFMPVDPWGVTEKNSNNIAINITKAIQKDALTENSYSLLKEIKAEDNKDETLPLTREFVRTDVENIQDFLMDEQTNNNNKIPMENRSAFTKIKYEINDDINYNRTVKSRSVVDIAGPGAIPDLVAARIYTNNYMKMGYKLSEIQSMDWLDISLNQKNENQKGFTKNCNYSAIINSKFNMIGAIKKEIKNKNEENTHENYSNWQASFVDSTKKIFESSEISTTLSELSTQYNRSNTSLFGLMNDFTTGKIHSTKLHLSKQNEIGNFNHVEREYFNNLNTLYEMCANNKVKEIAKNMNRDCIYLGCVGAAPEMVVFAIPLPLLFISSIISYPLEVRPTARFMGHIMTEDVLENNTTRIGSRDEVCLNYIGYESYVKNMCSHCYCSEMERILIREKELISEMYRIDQNGLTNSERKYLKLCKMLNYFTEDLFEEKGEDDKKDYDNDIQEQEEEEKEEAKEEEIITIRNKKKESSQSLKTKMNLIDIVGKKSEGYKLLEKTNKNNKIPILLNAKSTLHLVSKIFMKKIKLYKERNCPICFNGNTIIYGNIDMCCDGQHIISLTNETIPNGADNGLHFIIRSALYGPTAYCITSISDPAIDYSFIKYIKSKEFMQILTGTNEKQIIQDLLFNKPTISQTTRYNLEEIQINEEEESNKKHFSGYFIPKKNNENSIIRTNDDQELIHYDINLNKKINQNKNIEIENEEELFVEDSFMLYEYYYFYDNDKNNESEVTSNEKKDNKKKIYKKHKIVKPKQPINQLKKKNSFQIYGNDIQDNEYNSNNFIRISLKVDEDSDKNNNKNLLNTDEYIINGRKVVNIKANEIIQLLIWSLMKYVYNKQRYDEMYSSLIKIAESNELLEEPNTEDLKKQRIFNEDNMNEYNDDKESLNKYINDVFSEESRNKNNKLSNHLRTLKNFSPLIINSVYNKLKFIKGFVSYPDIMSFKPIDNISNMQMKLIPTYTGDINSIHDPLMSMTVSQNGRYLAVPQMHGQVILFDLLEQLYLGTMKMSERFNTEIMPIINQAPSKTIAIPSAITEILPEDMFNSNKDKDQMIAPNLGDPINFNQQKMMNYGNDNEVSITTLPTGNTINTYNNKNMAMYNEIIKNGVITNSSINSIKSAYINTIKRRRVMNRIRFCTFDANDSTMMVTVDGFGVIIWNKNSELLKITEQAEITEAKSFINTSYQQDLTGALTNNVVAISTSQINEVSVNTSTMQSLLGKSGFGVASSVFAQMNIIDEDEDEDKEYREEVLGLTKENHIEAETKNSSDDESDNDDDDDENDNYEEESETVRKKKSQDKKKKNIETTQTDNFIESSEEGNIKDKKKKKVINQNILTNLDEAFWTKNTSTNYIFSACDSLTRLMVWYNTNNDDLIVQHPNNKSLINIQKHNIVNLTRKRNTCIALKVIAIGLYTPQIKYTGKLLSKYAKEVFNSVRRGSFLMYIINDPLIDMILDENKINKNDEPTEFAEEFTLKQFKEEINEIRSAYAEVIKHNGQIGKGCASTLLKSDVFNHWPIEKFISTLNKYKDEGGVTFTQSTVFSSIILPPMTSRQKAIINQILRIFDERTRGRLSIANRDIIVSLIEEYNEIENSLDPDNIELQKTISELLFENKYQQTPTEVYNEALMNVRTKRIEELGIDSSYIESLMKYKVKSDKMMKAAKEQQKAEEILLKKELTKLKKQLNNEGSLINRYAAANSKTINVNNIIRVNQEAEKKAIIDDKWLPFFVGAGYNKMEEIEKDYFTKQGIEYRNKQIDECEPLSAFRMDNMKIYKIKNFVNKYNFLGLDKLLTETDDENNFTDKGILDEKQYTKNTNEILENISKIEKNLERIKATPIYTKLKIFYDPPSAYLKDNMIPLMKKIKVMQPIFQKETKTEINTNIQNQIKQKNQTKNTEQKRRGRKKSNTLDTAELDDVLKTVDTTNIL